MKSHMQVSGLRKLMVTMGALGLIVAFQNCSNTSFSSDSNKSNSVVATGDDTGVGGGDTPTGNDTPTTGGTTPGQDNPSVPCPLNVTNILVIDLKSGWWEGDGAGTFGNIAKKINDQCNKIVLEYGHITVEDNASAFPSKSFNDYDEIWVLSGANNDELDLAIDSTVFQRFLAGIKASSANLFIGSGNGAVMHANAITSAMGSGNLFVAGATSELAFTYTHKANNIYDVTKITKAQMSANHPLFTNVAELPDTIFVNGVTLKTDKLVSKTGLSPLVINSDKVSEVGSMAYNGRKVILEANLGRMYAVVNNDANVLNYIVNLMTTLRK